MVCGAGSTEKLTEAGVAGKPTLSVAVTVKLPLFTRAVLGIVPVQVTVSPGGVQPVGTKPGALLVLPLQLAMPEPTPSEQVNCTEIAGP